MKFAAAVKAPPIPSKTEIIPIHASDRGTFKKCRRKWDWSSPMRNNLQPRVDMQGVYMPLWFGSGVHYALAQYYNPVLQRDPVETFLWWWELQWKGGFVRESELDLVYDRHPIPQNTYSDDGQYVYMVRGLYDLLPEPSQEEFEEHRELGIGMLNFYKEYAEANDNFAVICQERTFSVPVILTQDLDFVEYGPQRAGEILQLVDPRDGVVKEVHLRGTQDAIIQDLETGQFGILEHKTAIRIDEDYHRKLEKDEQCTTYMFAAELEAELHDLEYTTISFTLYNALRKAYPKPPTELKSGLFSTNRQTESTTYAMLQQFIAERGLELIVESDEKLRGYVDYVAASGDKQFIERTPVRRNKHELRSCAERVNMEVLDMLSDPRIYPNPTGDWSCLNCIFRAPCIARDDGSDYVMLLEDNFEPNWTR
jgi:PD-(D/E)XK nuclease superfamily protein